jgi:hypothetical protein
LRLQQAKLREDDVADDEGPDNPYWHSEGQVHPIDLSALRALCFEIFNLFAANRALVHEFETTGDEETSSVSRLQQCRDRPPFIHGLVPFRHLVEVKDLARMDFAVPDEVNQLGPSLRRRRSPFPGNGISGPETNAPKRAPKSN